MGRLCLGDPSNSCRLFYQLFLWPAKSVALARSWVESRADSGRVQFVRLLAIKRHKNQVKRRRPSRVMGCVCGRLKTRKSPFLHFFMRFPCIWCCFSRIWYILLFWSITRTGERLRRWLRRRLIDETLTNQTTPKSAPEASMAPSYGCFEALHFPKNVGWWTILVSRWTFETIDFVHTQPFTR